MIAIGFGEVLGCCFTPLNDFIVTLGVFEKNDFLTKKNRVFASNAHGVGFLKISIFYTQNRFFQKYLNCHWIRWGFGVLFHDLHATFSGVRFMSSAKLHWRDHWRFTDSTRRDRSQQAKHIGLHNTLKQHSVHLIPIYNDLMRIWGKIPIFLVKKSFFFSKTPGVTIKSFGGWNNTPKPHRIRWQSCPESARIFEKIDFWSKKSRFLKIRPHADLRQNRDFLAKKSTFSKTPRVTIKSFGGWNNTPKPHQIRW